MSAGTTHPLIAALAQTQHDELAALDRGCRKRFGIGVTPRMHSLLEFTWNVIALAATVWFILFGIDPVYAFSFGTILFGAEKAFRAYLVGVGIADAENYTTDGGDDR